MGTSNIRCTRCGNEREHGTFGEQKSGEHVTGAKCNNCENEEWVVV